MIMIRYAPLVIVVALPACADNREPAAPRTIPVDTPATAPTRSIAIDGSDLWVCHQRQFTARGLDERGRALVALGVAWSSSDTLIASVSPSGLVKGISPGWFTIRAISGSDTALLRDRVSLAGVEVYVSPNTLTMVIGDSVPFSTKVFTGNDFELSSETITWRSLSPEVASVSAAGLVKAVGVGSTEIVADYTEPPDALNPAWCRANDATGGTRVNVFAP